MKNSIKGRGQQRATAVVLNNLPARVDKVHVEGICRTKDDFVMNMAKQLFEVTTFKEMFTKAIEVQNQFTALQCFKTIEIQIDTAKGAAESDNGYEVTYLVKENRRLLGGVSTMVGNNNDGSVVIQANLPNLNGRAESLQVMYQYGTQRTTGVNVDFVKPICPWSTFDPRFVASVYQHGSEYPWSSYRESNRGLSADLILKYSRAIRHSLRWEAVWREVAALSTGTAFAVREEAGHSLKSSLKHTLTIDQREGDYIPQRGSMFELKQEYAGVGGDISFHKHEVSFEHNIPLKLLADLVLQTTLRAGVMMPQGKTSITDKFFIGGPLSLRGYQLNGVGPHAEGCALGATSYWVANLHMYTRLPFGVGTNSFGEYFRTHFFLNTGNVGSFGFSSDYVKNSQILFNRMRMSVGLGLIVYLSGARLEFHYSVPIQSQPGDKADKGLQFGFGAQFV